MGFCSPFLSVLFRERIERVFHFREFGASECLLASTKQQTSPQIQASSNPAENRPEARFSSQCVKVLRVFVALFVSLEQQSFVALSSPEEEVVLGLTEAFSSELLREQLVRQKVFDLEANSHSLVRLASSSSTAARRVEGRTRGGAGESDSFEDYRSGTEDLLN